MNELVKYGVDTDLAYKANSLGLNITNIKANRKEILVSRFGLSEPEATILKACVTRKPIDEATFQALLENNAATCCVCQGNKSDAYVIHHIEHYNISQNNEYDNLALVCPNDHELAHREGEALANKITEKQLRKFKQSWEQKVEENKVRKATLKGEISDLDFVNIHRILELSLSFNNDVTETKYYNQLLNREMIQDDSSLNPKFYRDNNLNINTPLKFFAGFGSHLLIQHYFDILLNILKQVDVYDLDSLLTNQEIKNGIIGKFCYYVGGVYGRQYKGEINEDSENTSIHFRRKQFIVEWGVNPMFITSTTASWRIARRPVYAIYGKITSVSIVEIKGKKMTKIDVRPYAFGIAIERKNRVPLIHYIKQYEDYESEE